jgi:hypothetical protein
MTEPMTKKTIAQQLASIDTALSRQGFSLTEVWLAQDDWDRMCREIGDALFLERTGVALFAGLSGDVRVRCDPRLLPGHMETTSRAR